jgi:hypothetical protein
MRIIFLILVIVHGLIHLLGFVKAFGLSNIEALTQPISKPSGVVWLISFILFAIVAWMFASKSNYWWLFGILAVLISQALIIYFWKDAKFGTIANVIIFIVAIIGCGTWNFNSSYKKEVTKSLKLTSAIQESLLTEADIQYLPEQVRKYLHYTGAVGKPRVNNFKIEFTGKIRKDEQSEWMPFTSEQYNFVNTSTRLFFLNATMKHLPVTGFHCFKNGIASMDIRLLSLFKVQYQSGKEMDIAETVTFFNDMCCMAPATLIDKRIQWLEVDDNRVKASFTNNNITISAWLYFNDQGVLFNFISNDRYAVAEGNTMKRIPWSSPLKDYKILNGSKIAGYADAIYHYPEGDLCYGTFSLTNIEYNCKNIEF